MNTTVRRALAVVTIFSGAAVLAWAQGPAAASNQSFKPVQKLHHLMEGQKQLMGQIKDAIQDKSWEEAQTSAWILAELANVNQYQRNEPEFVALATKMSGQCVELASILKKRDAAAATEQSKAIGQTCKSCHEKYEKKKENRKRRGPKDKGND